MIVTAVVVGATAVGVLAGVTAPAQARPVPGSVSWLVKSTGTIINNSDGTRTSTLALTPSTVTLHQLDRLGWKDRDAITEPHLYVFTQDSTEVLGRTIDDGQPCSLCDTASSEMAAAQAANPNVTRVEHGDLGGLDVRGDCYLDRVNDDVWLRVKSPPGTVWYYMDAYHPWLHGEVDVT
jgi:hypothetical protein